MLVINCKIEMCDKIRGANVRYHSMLTRLLDSICFFGCLQMLPLHDVAIDDVYGNDTMPKFVTSL